MTEEKEAPDPGSSSWLWFKPEENYEGRIGIRQMACEPCQVRFNAYYDKDTKFIKCFNCGKFKRLPYRG